MPPQTRSPSFASDVQSRFAMKQRRARTTPGLAARHQRLQALTALAQTDDEQNMKEVLRIRKEIEAALRIQEAARHRAKLRPRAVRYSSAPEISSLDGLLIGTRAQVLASLAIQEAARRRLSLRCGRYHTLIDCPPPCSSPLTASPDHCVVGSCTRPSRSAGSRSWLDSCLLGRTQSAAIKASALFTWRRASIDERLHVS